MRIVNFSNIIFIFPLAEAIISKMYVGGALVCVLWFFSTLYHKTKEKKFLAFDFVSSVSLVSYNLFLLFKISFKLEPFLFAFVAMLMGFYFYFKAWKKEYEVNHAYWHVAYGLITTICFTAYLIFK